ncbi:MAG: NADH:flavin oxidoreductase [Fusobacteriaceae bacterium]
MKTIFDKTDIKNLTAKNRAVRSATNERNFCSENGEMTKELLEVYSDLILGGTGTIITSFANVMKNDQPAPYMLGIYDDKFIPGYKPIIELAQANNCKIILQIVYGGSQTLYNLENRTILGPSSVENLYSKVTPKMATEEELSEIVTAFGDAALRAKKAGFHGVQIHGAHGYFLSQFLNPYYNRRDDKYGGTIENRGRLIFEVYEEIRNRVGKDYFVSIKINCEDFMEKGATLEDNLYLCKKLSEMGIDLIEVSGGSASSEPGKGVIRMMKSSDEESYFYNQGKKIAETVSAPVALVGGHKNIERIEDILNSSKIEFISLSRPLVSEPDLINRWIKDRSRAKCISCNRCFLNGKRCVLI